MPPLRGNDSLKQCANFQAVLWAITLVSCLLFGNQQAQAATIASFNMDTDPGMADAVPTGPDDYENDDTSTTAAWAGINDTKQMHNFHDRGDTDWVQFYASPSTVLSFYTLDLGSDADTTLALYASGSFTTPLATDTNPAELAAVILNWTVPADGYYYIKIRNSNAKQWLYGANAYYAFKIVKISGGPNLTAVIDPPRLGELYHLEAVGGVVRMGKNIVTKAAAPPLQSKTPLSPVEFLEYAARPGAGADTGDCNPVWYDRTTYEPVIPFTQPVTADSPLAIRLRSEAEIDPASLYSSGCGRSPDRATPATAGLLPGAEATVEWQPAGDEGDLRDLWVFCIPADTWYLDDLITLGVSGTADDGTTVTSETYNFQVESREDYTTRGETPQEIVPPPVATSETQEAWIEELIGRVGQIGPIRRIRRIRHRRAARRS